MKLDRFWEELGKVKTIIKLYCVEKFFNRKIKIEIRKSFHVLLVVFVGSPS